MLTLLLYIIGISWLVVSSIFSLFFITLLILDSIKWRVLPFRPITYLLNYNEYQFYKALKTALDGTPYTIFTKVRLGDLTENTNKLTKYFYWSICYRHVDFLICDPNLRPLKAIELDGNSHERPYEKKKDNYKNKLFKIINIPLIRIPVQSVYAVEDLRKKVIYKQ